MAPVTRYQPVSTHPVNSPHHQKPVSSQSDHDPLDSIVVLDPVVKTSIIIVSPVQKPSMYVPESKSPLI
jgi:hypothetical protein